VGTQDGKLELFTVLCKDKELFKEVIKALVKLGVPSGKFCGSKTLKI
jgi:hypothetical protein